MITIRIGAGPRLARGRCLADQGCRGGSPASSLCLLWLTWASSVPAGPPPPAAPSTGLDCCGPRTDRQTDRQTGRRSIRLIPDESSLPDGSDSEHRRRLLPVPALPFQLAAAVHSTAQHNASTSFGAVGSSKASLASLARLVRVRHCSLQAGLAPVPMSRRPLQCEALLIAR